MSNLQLPAIDPHARIILFDAVCKLCNHWSRFILRFDKHQRFTLCPVQSPAGQALLAHYDFPLDRFDTLLLIHNGVCLTRSDAIIAIMRAMPLPWSLLALLRWLPKRLRDAGYNIVARNRYGWFGRYDHCALPPEGYQKRFLE